MRWCPRAPKHKHRHADKTKEAAKESDLERVNPAVREQLSSNETLKQAVMAGLGLSFLSLHTMGLELRSGLLHILDLEGTPVMRMWNVEHLQSRVLSPAAEAFRYLILERGAAHLHAHDVALIGGPP